MKKKTFADDIQTAQQDFFNPANQFISSAPQGGIKAAPQARPQPRTETRTRGVHLLLPPSLHERIKERAGRERVSVNQIIIDALENYLI